MSKQKLGLILAYSAWAAIGSFTAWQYNDPGVLVIWFLLAILATGMAMIVKYDLGPQPKAEPEVGADLIDYLVAPKKKSETEGGKLSVRGFGSEPCSSAELDKAIEASKKALLPWDGENRRAVKENHSRRIDDKSTPDEG